MGEEKSGEKQGRDWKTLIAEKGRELSAVGEGELEEEVRRELISREASKIVREMARSPAHIRNESELARTGEWPTFHS